jgi:hypothetical protein
LVPACGVVRGDDDIVQSDNGGYIGYTEPIRALCFELGLRAGGESRGERCAASSGEMGCGQRSLTPASSNRDLYGGATRAERQMDYDDSLPLMRNWAKTGIWL